METWISGSPVALNGKYGDGDGYQGTQSQTDVEYAAELRILAVRRPESFFKYSKDYIHIIREAVSSGPD